MNIMGRGGDGVDAVHTRVGDKLGENVEKATESSALDDLQATFDWVALLSSLQMAATSTHCTGCVVHVFDPASCAPHTLCRRFWFR